MSNRTKSLSIGTTGTVDGKESETWSKRVVQSDSLSDFFESHIPVTWHLITLASKFVSAVVLLVLDISSPLLVLIALDVALILAHALSRQKRQNRPAGEKVASPADRRRKEPVQSIDIPKPMRNRAGAVCTKQTIGNEQQSISPASSSSIHVAGSSTNRCKPGCFPQPGVDVMAWQDAIASKFKLRIGPDYKKTNAKAASADALYELVGVDVIRCTKERLSKVGSNSTFSLPAHRVGIDPSLDDIKKAEVPRLFIVNAQIPDKAPSILGAKKKTDDTGHSMVFYFSVKKDVVAQLIEARGACSPAIKLLYKYVHDHDKDPDLRRRFKAIGMADVKDLGIPGVGTMIEKFNGKPAIINKVAEIYSSGPDWDWFEVDISIYDFPFLAQKALSSLKDRISEIGLRAGFVFQGETDDELPETLLGGAEMCVDFTCAKVI